MTKQIDCPHCQGRINLISKGKIIHIEPEIYEQLVKGNIRLTIDQDLKPIAVTKMNNVRVVY